MKAVALLVTGSRALEDSPEAIAWARAKLRRHIDALPPGSLVVVGDAVGPDTWAREIATERGIEWHRVNLDGTVDLSNGPGFRWCTPERVAEGKQRRDKRWPLVRNEATVNDAVASVDNTREARVLALKAPWSSTDGTGQTVGLAKAAKLRGVLATCPPELGPSAVAESERDPWKR